MNKAFTLFAWLSLGAILLMGIFDLVFFIIGGPGQTLSYQFWHLAKEYPIIPWLLGVLNGHLIWQYDPDEIQPVQSQSQKPISSKEAEQTPK